MLSLWPLLCFTGFYKLQVQCPVLTSTPPEKRSQTDPLPFRQTSSISFLLYLRTSFWTRTSTGEASRGGGADPRYHWRTKPALPRINQQFRDASGRCPSSPIYLFISSTCARCILRRPLSPINTSTLIRLRRARASGCQVGAEGNLPLACSSIPVSLPPRIRSTKEFRKHHGGSSVQNHSTAPSFPRRHLVIHNILFYASKYTVIFLPRS